MNLPNRLTVGRLLLATIYFTLMAFVGKRNDILVDICLGIFIIAVLTDVLDGYLARRYNMVTIFGRIADPFVDKVIVCGSFVFLASWEVLRDFIPAWMVVIILAREFIVSTLRSFAESRGISFASTFWGKHKMAVQSFTIGCALFYLGHMQGVLWAGVILKILIWLTISITIISGLIYLARGWRILKVRKDI